MFQGEGDETGFHPGKNSWEHQYMESSYISFSLSNFNPLSVIIRLAFVIAKIIDSPNWQINTLLFCSLDNIFHISDLILIGLCQHNSVTRLPVHRERGVPLADVVKVGQ